MNTPTLDPEIGRPNPALDNDQTLRIRARLKNAQDKLRMWDRELALLLARCGRIADRIYRCHVALAPYKKLPVEIMREIILIVVGIPHSLPLHKEITLDPRLQITHVCVNWRQIAFATPELWNFRFTPLPSLSTVKLAGAWWSQCSGSQLSLTIDDDLQNTDIPAGNRGDNFLFEHIITPHSSRLVNLQIYVRAATATKLLALPAGSFKALRTLSLRVDPYDGLIHSLTRLDHGLNTAFSLCPHLYSMNFITSSTVDPWMLRMSWSQLTDLKLTVLRVPADLILLVLSQCPLLRLFYITSIKDIDADMVSRISTTCPTPLCLTKVETFIVTFSSSANHMHFLRALSLPKLFILQLYRHGFIDCPPSVYTAFFQSVGSTLATFEILDFDPERAGAVPSFQVDETLFLHTPHLLAFTLPDNYCIGPLALEEIASGGLLPFVVAIELGIQDPESIVRMLEIRLSHACDSGGKISMIQEVSFRCPAPNVGFKLKDRLDTLLDWGVNVIMINPQHVVPHV